MRCKLVAFFLVAKEKESLEILQREDQNPSLQLLLLFQQIRGKLVSDLRRENG